MTIEEAIKTALEYETKIRDIYKDAAERISDPVAKRTLQMLRDDEQYHIDYLRRRLELWQKTGKLSADKLDSVIPPKETIRKEIEKIEDIMPKDDPSAEIEILSKALKAEVETSNFYRKMVDEMTDEGQQMFARFLEIEDNHIAAVQAELDYITKTGYWFDFKEFDMEEM
ncbi:MAG: ferritin family protein [Deltaproteobacteria bacterium]|nr:ferritin family protein [Deltaproteobacteria bacterium]